MRRIRTHLGIIGAYAALALGVTYPLVLHLATHVPMPAYLHAEPWRHVYWFHLWSLWLAKQQVAHWPPPLATDLIFYPVGVWIPWLTQIVSTAAFAVPLQTVFGLVAVGNIILIGGLTLAAYFACLLAHRVTSDWPPALLCGAIFASAPIVTANLQGHLYVISGLPCLPLYVLLLLKTLDEPTRAHALAAGAVFSVSMLAYWYDAVFLTLFTAVLVPLRLLETRRDLEPRRLVGAALAFAAIVVPVALALVVPFVFRPNPIAPQAPLQSSLDEMRGWSVDLLAFFLPAYDHWLAGPFVRATRAAFTGNFTLQTAFLGYTALALTAVAIVKAASAAVRAWTICAAVFFLLALGPSLHVHGTDRGVPLPLALLHAVPPVSGVRDLSMYVIPLMLCVAVLAAAGLDIVVRGRKRGTRRALAAFAFALVAAEYAVLPFPLFAAEMPAPYARIVSDREPSTVLELPLSTTTPVYEFYQSQHGKPLLTGYFNRLSPWYDEYADSFPVVRVLKDARVPADVDPHDVDAFLRFFHIRYIVVHRSIAGADEHRRLTALLRARFPASLLADDGDAAAYRVDLAPEQPTFPIVLDFSPDRPDPIVTLNFSTSERREGLTASWATGTASSVWLNLPADRDLTLTARVQPFVYAGAPPQAITLSVNGRAAGAAVARDGWSDAAFHVPAQALAAGMNRFDFAYAYCGSTADIAGSGNSRCLAVAFDLIRIGHD